MATQTDEHTAATAYAAGFQSYVDGYTSTGACPYAVYMSEKLRQHWLRGWAAASRCPQAHGLREAGFVERSA